MPNQKQAREQHVTLAEAASLLGVSKATLRNWDKAGKLNALRHPVNGYRLYQLAELQQLQNQIGLPLNPEPTAEREGVELLDTRVVKRVIGRLHDVMRDADSQSNIIGRFDEITKLIFAKVMADRNLSSAKSPFSAVDGGSPKSVKQFYARLAARHPDIIPRRFAVLSCSDNAITESIDVLRAFDFGAAKFDFKGLAYEEVIRNTFDKGDHQQFFTPPQIVDFIVSMCSPYVRGEVCDPAAGTGGFLASVARHSLQYDSLTAIEIDERLAWVAGINMFLHDAHDIRTLCLPNGGTLGADIISRFGSFDTIITNPPFGSDFSDRSALETMDLGVGRSSRRRGILFIERCHKLLADGGTLAIIIDEGVLNLPHAEDVRRFITATFDIRAVVNLPDSAFMPYATVNASILLLAKRSATDNNRSVFFAKAETVGRKANGDDDVRYDREGKPYLESDLPHILEDWEKHLIGDSRIRDNAYVTDINDNITEAGSGYRLDFSFHHPSRLESAKLLHACPYPLRRLGELCVEKNLPLIPSQELPDTIIRYTGLAHIESATGIAIQEPTPANSLKSAVKRYEPGEIIFAKMRPNLRKVALMDFDEAGYVSPECSVFGVRPSDDGSPRVDPLLLSILLRSDFVFGQIMHLIAGIGRPRISTTELKQVMIPIPPSSVQREIKRVYLETIAESGRLRRESEALRTAATRLGSQSVARVAEIFSGRSHELTSQ